MSSDMPGTGLIDPPADVPDARWGEWLTLEPPGAVAEYLGAELWDHAGAPGSWEVARLSHAAYVYRETSSRWAAVAKFYTPKTGDQAQRYAEQEFELTQRAGALLQGHAQVRAVRPLATWRGVLFLEYHDGLTLEDVIAVRRSRPGTLDASLAGAARLLATLHARGTQPKERPDLNSPVAYARELVRELAQWGVLESNPAVQDGLLRLIDRWAADPAMRRFAPVLSHGDATTTNFIFPWGGGVVAVDWERMQAADPAADIGRLMAEVSHSINQHGGSVSEAVPRVERLADHYRRALPDTVDARSLLERAPFYQASSALRIARNGWIPRLDRMALVAHALALLTR